MSSFKPWLLKQTARKDPVGDLAQDVKGDKQWPKYAKLPELYEYLKSCDACEDALETLLVAWREYQTSISPDGFIPIERWGLRPKVDMSPEDHYRLNQFERKRHGKKAKTRQVSLAMRFEVLQRDGFRCKLCGANPETGAVLEVDHIHPKSKGGQTTYSNLWTLCFECNRGKSDRDL